MDRVLVPDGQPDREEYRRDGIGPQPEPPRPVSGDERRMQVRAYNRWVALLNGRRYPAVDEIDPAAAGDLGTHGVLLDFSLGDAEPRIRFVGHAVRAECGVTSGIRRIADVPQGSLLARLVEHYPRILASRAPISFEAEFVSQRGFPTLYRGILMPFSSDQQRIDFLYGVINWKEVVDAGLQARLTAEIVHAHDDHASPYGQHGAAPAALVASAWADGPSAGLDAAPRPLPAAAATDALRTAPSLGSAAIDAAGEPLVLLIARPGTDGRVEVVARVDADDALLAEAVRRAR